MLMATIEKHIKGQEEKRRLTHIFSVMANTNSLKVEAPSTSDQLVNKLKINKYTYTLALIFMLHGQKNPSEENNFRVDNKSHIQRDLRSKLALLTEEIAYEG